ncbi:MAG TPA: hypothetical protein VKI40_11140 [Terriglobales bacterium]|nr:hypothetical protein [Terriglobales bacterium]
MKAKVRIAMHQADMRSRLKRRIATNAKVRPEKTPSAGEPDELKRQIAATVLHVNRGWSAARIARHFDWPRKQEVERWLEAGERWLELGKLLL